MTPEEIEWAVLSTFEKFVGAREEEMDSGGAAILAIGLQVVTSKRHQRRFAAMLHEYLEAANAPT